MKMMLTAMAFAALMLTASGVAAQTTPDDSASPFEGATAGASVDHRRHEVKRTAPTLSDRVDEQEGGIGYRAFAGYDKTFGGIGLIGVEAGVGNGGRDVKSDVIGGTYRMNPGWAWDASVRLGVMPVRNVLLYGRGGYGWTRAKETIDFTAPASTDVTAPTKTHGGFMYGFGGEFLVAKGFALRTEFDQTNFGKGFKAARVQLGGVVRF